MSTGNRGLIIIVKIIIIIIIIIMIIIIIIIINATEQVYKTLERKRRQIGPSSIPHHDLKIKFSYRNFLLLDTHYNVPDMI